MVSKKWIALVLILGVILFQASTLLGVEKSECDLTDMNLWTSHGKQVEVVTYKGKEGLRILPGYGQGYALLKDVEFENGIIEADIAALPRFTGILFRHTGDNDYEAVYFRPQNSRPNQ